MIGVFSISCSTNDDIESQSLASEEEQTDILSQQKDDTTSPITTASNVEDEGGIRFCVSGYGNFSSSIWLTNEGRYIIYSAWGTQVETTRAYAISWCAEHGNPPPN